MTQFSRFWQRRMQAVARLWRSFRALAIWLQILIGALVLAVLIGLVSLAHSGSSDDAGTAPPTVTLQSIDSFGANGTGVDVLGTVQSVSQADIVAQSGGTVVSVHAKIGQNVAAGYVIAELDNAAQSAAVLQAKGGYDSAVAARRATQLQSANTTGSLAEAQTSVRNTYRTVYTSLDTTLENNVDVFFGGATPVGPQLLISPGASGDQLPRERARIKTLLANWNATLPSVNTTDPDTLITNAETTLTEVSTFLTALAQVANDPDSNATPAQQASLATARSTVNSLLATLSASRDAYHAKETAAAVGQTQADSSSNDVASADAVVEQALGGLRAAQAAYEKTVVRAPIAGTLNYLSVHVGDNLAPNQKVATVAHNNALEIVTYLSENDRDRIAVGDSLLIENTYKGIVTSVAPALDPTTKQIEVHIAVADGASLVDGQSVHIALPSPTAVETPSTMVASTTSSTTPAIELPLAAVKLRASDRVVFTVNAQNQLVAHVVTIGDVVGNRIEITTPLDRTLQIVSDARGLSEGETVTVSTSTVSE